MPVICMTILSESMDAQLSDESGEEFPSFEVDRDSVVGVSMFTFFSGDNVPVHRIRQGLVVFRTCARNMMWVAQSGVKACTTMGVCWTCREESGHDAICDKLRVWTFARA